MESVFKSDKNQLAPVEEVPVYVLSLPRTKTLPKSRLKLGFRSRTFWLYILYNIQYNLNLFCRSGVVTSKTLIEKI